MADLVKSDGSLPVAPKTKSEKIETYAGKKTARVTRTYPQPDGSLYKLTRKINMDGSISDKVEHRHK